MIKFKQPIIVNAQVVLRPPQQQWAKGIYQIIDHQREYLGKWLPWVDKTTSVEHIRTFLRESILFNAGGQRLTTFIFYKDRLVGSIGFVRLDKTHKTGEIGYWLSQEAQGRGIVTQSCKGLSDYGFRHLGLQRAEIRVLVGNERSMPIPERAGFRYEGTLRSSAYLRQRPYDVNLFAMIRSDWAQQNTRHH